MQLTDHMVVFQLAWSLWEFLLWLRLISLLLLLLLLSLLLLFIVIIINIAIVIHHILIYLYLLSSYILELFSVIHHLIMLRPDGYFQWASFDYGGKRVRDFSSLVD